MNDQRITRDLNEAYENVTEVVMSIFKNREDSWKNEKRLMLRQIEELKNFHKVSMVKSLSSEVSELKIQNQILLTRLKKVESVASETKQVSAPVPIQIKIKPKIIAKNHEEEQEAEEEEQAEVEEEQEEEEPVEEEEQTESKPVEDEEQEEEKQTEPKPVKEQEEQEVQEEQEEQEEEEQEEPLELDYIELKTGTFLYDINTLEVYNTIKDEEDLQEPIGKIRKVTIRKKNHIIDHENNIYEYNLNNDVIEPTGSVGVFQDKRAKFFIN